MCAEDNKNEEQIYYQAISKPPEQRQAYLKEVCGDDAELLGRLEVLLKAHDQAGSFLDAPPFDPNVTLNTSPLTEGPGTIIGRYKLLEQIGEGGFGVVYMAEQQEPIRRRVALKIIKLGMDTKQVIARFEAERQALAMMDHPNIAGVLDAGATETGRPYFVMELVKGIPITEYCDKNNLDTQQRLELFIDVCKAVQHAHQKGIIHRDIKPSNVMITLHDGKPVPKVIDFGIAKATSHRLTEKTLFTKYAQMIGTPEYMSPEQAEMSGLDIDTRTDIYSLGVLLYELLTSATPFDAKELREAGYIQMQRIIRETEPLRPSTKLNTMGDALTDIAKHRQSSPALLPKLVRGDLDWIAMKTLEKDRTRRYETANELAMDIERHLSNEPVEASPPSTLYRFRKLVQKHRRTVAAVITIAASLIIGLLVSTTMYLVANRARQNEAVARTKAEQAEKVAQEQKNIAETKAEDLRRSMYVNNIQLADAKYKEGNIRRVRELLDSCPNDLRGWEWYRLNHIMDQSSKTLRGHENFIRSMALSPDGKRVASGDSGGTVRLWDWGTGAELATFQPYTGVVSSVAFSPDGKLLASCSFDQTIKVLDVSKGQEVMTLRGHQGWVRSVAFSPDGKFLASGDDRKIRIWDMPKGEEVMTLGGQQGGICSVVFDPNGKRIASGNSNATVTIWDAASGEKLMDLSGHKGAVNSVRFSPDGKHIASGSYDGTIRLWDAATGKQLMILRAHTTSVDSVAYDPSGKLIVSAGGRIISVWDASTGEEVINMRGHCSDVSQALFSLEGKMVISSSWDKTIKVWDIDTCGERIMTQISKVFVDSLALSPDGKHFVSGGYQIRKWDAETGTELMNLSGRTGLEGRFPSVSFSPDGKRIVSCGPDKTVSLWDAITGKEIMTFRGHYGFVRSVAFSPNGRRIVSSSQDKTIIIWDTTTGAEVMKLPGLKNWAVWVVYSPDGSRIVSGGTDGTIKVWNAENGAELMTLSGHKGATLRVTFSPDGKFIASSGQDATAKLWDAETGGELMTLYGEPARLVDAICFSPDGKRFVSASKNETIMLWDVATGAELMTVGSSVSVDSVAFSPDGKTIFAGGDGIMLWETTKPAGGYGPRKTGKIATKLVDELYEKHGFYYDVIDKLSADKTLDESIRNLALQIANSRKGEDAEKLVDEMYKKYGSYDEVIEKLQADKALDEPTHKLALQIADSRKAEDAEKLMREIGEQMMQMVSSPGGDPNAYRAALEKVEKASLMDPNNPKLLVALGMIQHFAGQYEDAIKTLTKARRLGPDLPAMLGPLSEAQYRAGKYEDALKTLTEELEIDRRVLGEEHQDTLNSMDNMGVLYLHQSRYKEAEPLLVKALEIRRRVLGEEHPDTLESMNNLAGLYQAQGRYNEAEPLLTKALEGRRRVKGEEHPDTLLSMNNLGLLYLTQGRYNEAEPLIVKALEGRSRVLGEEHPDIGYSMTGLGMVYYRQGRYDKADATLRRSEEIRTKSHLEPEPANLAFIAMALHQLGRTEEAKGNLDRLRDLLKNERFAKDEKEKAHLAEAEKLIEGEK